jgi:hypothetical protein
MSKGFLSSHSESNRENKIQSSESEVQPTAAQLLSVIEFSRNFPELTQQIAATTLHKEEQQGPAVKIHNSEFFEFPQLTALDPRKIRSRVAQKEIIGTAQGDAPEPLDEIALFAVGQLPPPELPTQKRAAPKKNKKIGKIILSLMLFFFFLCFLYLFEMPGNFFVKTIFLANAP